MRFTRERSQFSGPYRTRSHATRLSRPEGEIETSNHPLCKGRRYPHKRKNPNTGSLRTPQGKDRLHSRAKTSGIHHEEARTVVAFYPCIIYSPGFYRYIHGYPLIDENNPYLISRYDGTVIDAQPWGPGGEARDIWDGFASARIGQNSPESSGNSDWFWRILSKPLEFTRGHYVHHLAKDFEPNVMVCPYDFPFGESGMRVYIPNLVLGREEGENKRKMRRYGSFLLRLGKAEDAEAGVLFLKTLVSVSTRRISDGEEKKSERAKNQRGQKISKINGLA
ncbi:hypothetical protein AMTRI_Chr09g38260 [Amborella trichopoda]